MGGETEMSSQRQCKRYRKAVKELDEQRERFWRLVNYFERRPPVWRVFSYMKWEKGLREIL